MRWSSERGAGRRNAAVASGGEGLLSRGGLWSGPSPGEPLATAAVSQGLCALLQRPFRQVFVGTCCLGLHPLPLSLPLVTASLFSSGTQLCPHLRPRVACKPSLPFHCPCSHCPEVGKDPSFCPSVSLPGRCELVGKGMALSIVVLTVWAMDPMWSILPESKANTREAAWRMTRT